MSTRVGSRIWLFQNLWRSVLVITLFLHQDAAAVDAGNNENCPPSSCGEIHRISYPFRLDTDPPNCGFSYFSGDRNLTLYCHNNSSLFLYLNNNNSGDGFLVKGINYDDFTIHLVDPGVQQNNCSSLPISPVSKNPYYTTDLARGGKDGFNSTSLSSNAVLISCDRKPVNNRTFRISKYFVEIIAPYRGKGRKYSYVILGGRYVPLEPEMESCSIDMITLVSFTGTNDNVTSYQEIHTRFSDGFHLSWLPVFCQLNCSRYENCYLDQANRPTCYTYTYSSTSVIRITLYSIVMYIYSAAMFHGLVALLGTPCVFALLIYKWRRRHLSSYSSVEEFLQNQTDLTPIRYSYKNLKNMTTNFKDKLGEGGFGCVYKGKLRSGRLAAIKISDKSSKATRGQDFMNEVATIGRIHHVNVVQMVGYCAEQSKRALVYDFMSNGSLDKYIFAKEGYVSLSWDKLLEISIGIARGIEYLHRGCDMQILHFDIKPHNILLDENFIPKVSDFGLAKLYPTTKDTIASLTAARGTIGYMAPELFYKNIGRVSYKADVYSFGMLLLEIAGKRKSLNAMVEKSSQIYFPSWVYDQVANGNDIEIGENDTEGDIKIVKKMIIVGLWCIQMKPSNRPSMNKVTGMLEGDMESLEMPPKPMLCLEEMPNVAETSESYLSDESSESISLIESAG